MPRSPITKLRLDQALVERGLAQSRHRAKALILGGRVFVEGKRWDKAGRSVPGDARIELRGEIPPYVSRGGIKLAAALDAFGIDPAGKRCLDLGISTGGFTDCLLQRGAARVVGVDVGYGQTAWKIRQDERVVLHERTNARYLSRDIVGEAVDLAVMDLSFISLKLVLPAVVECLAEGGFILALVKPQFEAGREKVGAGGVVRDDAVRRDAVESVRSFGRDELALRDLGIVESPITGPKGNRETFVLFRRLL